ncbi:MAG TPA: CooT family nickel-binding protein [Desulfobacteraceae bacterium]|nr:CooT family nickel-binding protein [Desulfobacteraceae bacterium]
MCEQAVYLLEEGKERLFMESVEQIQCQNDEIVIYDIFGREEKIKGKVKRLNLLDHKIFIMPS